MPTLRSIRWVFAMAPVLLLVTACGENNESRIDTKGTTSAPEAVSPTTPEKVATPPSYPGAARRK
jgi:hypothetical protein